MSKLLTRKDIHPTFQHALGVHEGFRKLGFDADDIFVHLNPDCSMLVVLKTQGKSFAVTVGFYPQEKSPPYSRMSSPKDNPTFAAWSKDWTELATQVRDGKADESELTEIWKASMPYNHKMSFIEALLSKGIVIPNPTSSMN